MFAILFKEPGFEQYVSALTASDTRLVCSVNAFETAVVVLVRKGAAALRELDLFMHVAGIEVVPFTQDHLSLAREAYQRFGKGRHPAQLNLGDCCAYALSRHAGEPLL